MSADAWNGSWGQSWGSAWGSLFAPARLGPGPMGGIVVHETSGPVPTRATTSQNSAKLRGDIAEAITAITTINREDEEAALWLLLS